MLLTGKTWRLSAPQKVEDADALLGVLLKNRGIAEGQDEEQFLSEEDGIWHDPFLYNDMRKAVDIINETIDRHGKVLVYGDYDCDGVTAAAILYSYLSEIGGDVISYIPERAEGYGLNNGAIDRIADMGVQLIVTVDNGITAINEAEHIYERGMRLLVTDHHQQGESLPRAEAIVDPHRHDDFSPFKYGC